MQASDFRAAGEFAKNYGVKALIYGPAGTGKTPILNTAPRPMLLACEPGLLSMRGSKIPTWEAYTAPRIDEFFRWFNTSAEVKNFDTLGIDSTSQMADIYLQEAKKTIKHGLQQYGQMAEYTVTNLRQVYFKPQMHAYLIAKEEIVNVNGVSFRRPYFPGQQLNADIPYMYDAILHLNKVPIPNVGDKLAFRCIGSYDVLARNRTGTLNEYEFPNFNDIINKSMV
jgi:hypothetical protein